MRKEYYEIQRALLYSEMINARSIVKQNEVHKKIQELESAWYLQEQAKHKGEDDERL